MKLVARTAFARPLMEEEALVPNPTRLRPPSFTSAERRGLEDRCGTEELEDHGNGLVGRRTKFEPKGQRALAESNVWKPSAEPGDQQTMLRPEDWRSTVEPRWR
ncbi:hypothetical protein ROHU_011779 [Labeo rohita]|uniref:Uncharacterized protein n=1 Tax=Labeo rohita TaxID=84645 RepID=A0A498LJ26_LABRO|nr:hypothetical protein ROHU_011779 [Labeo rohita]